MCIVRTFFLGWVWGSRWLHGVLDIANKVSWMKVKCDLRLWSIQIGSHDWGWKWGHRQVGQKPGTEEKQAQWEWERWMVAGQDEKAQMLKTNGPARQGQWERWIFFLSGFCCILLWVGRKGFFYMKLEEVWILWKVVKSMLDRKQ